MSLASEISITKGDKKNPPSMGGATTLTTTTSRKRLALRQLISRFLQRYTAAVGNSLHRDRLLKTLQYTLWWYGHLASSKAGNQLSLEICWARYITRGTEWPTSWEAVWNDSWTPFTDPHNPHSRYSRLGKLLGRILAWSMVAYYPAEHLAFARWKVSPSSPLQRLAEKYSAWSCRAWLVYILADIVQASIALTTQPVKPPDDDDPATKQAALARRHKQYVVLTRNLLFLLPAYHWSLPNWDTRPWLKSTTVNLFMWLEAVVSLYQTTLEVK